MLTIFIEDDLREMFEKFGPLTEVNLPIDKMTRRSKGFAFITFVMPEHAVQAFSQLDGSTYQVRFTQYFGTPFWSIQTTNNLAFG